MQKSYLYLLRVVTTNITKYANYRGFIITAHVSGQSDGWYFKHLVRTVRSLHLSEQFHTLYQLRPLAAQIQQAVHPMQNRCKIVTLYKSSVRTVFIGSLPSMRVALLV